MINIHLSNQVCQECHGQGKQISKGWEEYFLFNVNPANKIKTHKKPKKPIYFRCKKCNGTGGILTDKDQNIIA